MDANHNFEKLTKFQNGKNGFIKYKIPIFEIPKDNDTFIYFMFNEEIKNIEIKFIKKDSTLLSNYNINNFPVEKCEKCQNFLYLDDLCFISKEKDVEFYCGNCKQVNNSIIEFSFSKNNSLKNGQIIEKLNLYLKKNKDTSEKEYNEIMQNFISFTNVILLLLEQFETKDAFYNQVALFQNYIDNVSIYFDIVTKFQMNNVYLFLKNFFAFSVDKIDENFLYGFLKYHYENINNFNVSKIQSGVLGNIFNSTKNQFTLFLENVKFKIENKKNIFMKDIGEINKDYSSLKYEISERKISWLEKKMKIKELKDNIINFLRNYNYSYNYISSKKVLERKFINEILYVIFKNNYQRFSPIEETDSLINSIQKELKNIKYFLDKQTNSKNSTLEELKKKIINEVDFWEGKKSNKNFLKKGKSSQKEKGNKIYSLSNEEKVLLNKYLSFTSDDFFTSIYASKDKIFNVINNERLQVILEFLFFIRDKTIDIIHLFNKTAPLFFEFLKSGLNNEQGTESEKNKIVEIKSDDEEYNEEEDLERLQMEFNSNIEGNKMKNEEIFNKSSASSINEIKCLSALEYISNFKLSNDYSSELKYLFEKIVLPERKTKVEINNIENEGEEINYYEVLQKK